MEGHGLATFLVHGSEMLSAVPTPRVFRVGEALRYCTALNCS